MLAALVPPCPVGLQDEVGTNVVGRTRHQLHTRRSNSHHYAPHVVGPCQMGRLRTLCTGQRIPGYPGKRSEVVARCKHRVLSDTLAAATARGIRRPGTRTAVLRGFVLSICSGNYTRSLAGMPVTMAQRRRFAPLPLPLPDSAFSPANTPLFGSSG